MVSSPKKKFLEKKAGGVKYTQYFDYVVVLALIFVLSMNAFWADSIKMQRNLSATETPVLTSKSPGYAITVTLAILSGVTLLYIVFRPYIPFRETYRNVVVLLALSVIIVASVLLREVYYYWANSTPLGSSTSFEGTDSFMSDSMLSGVMASCFVAILICCGLIFKEL